MRNKGISAFFLIFLIALSINGPGLAAQVKIVSLEKIIIRVSEPMVQILDLRDPEAFQEFRFKNSVNIPLQDLGAGKKRIGGKTVFLVDYRGEESKKAALSLGSEGYDNVYCLEGGILGAFKYLAANENKKPGAVRLLRELLIPSAPVPGIPAPDFTLKDLDGKERKLSEFKGRTGALLFFGDPLSTQDGPLFETLAAEASRSNFMTPILILDGLDENAVGQVKAYLSDSGYEGVALLDRDSTVSKLYQVKSLPAVGVVDKQGVLWLMESDVMKPIAYYSYKTAMDLALGALKGKPIPFPESPLFGTEKTPRELVGSQAPDFKLIDRSGKTRALSEFRGRHVVLVFWNITCPYSRKLIQALSTYYSSKKDKSKFEIAGVEQPPENGIQKGNEWFLRDAGCTFPILFDPGGVVSGKYRATTTPVSFLIDDKGKILRAVVGFDEGIADILDEIYDL